MASCPASQPDGWQVCEPSFDLDRMAAMESVFALSNGHIGIRATFEEGEPHAEPGTYLNGVYETRRLQHPEPGYGFPEDQQAVVPVTNGTIVRLLVDDEPFDLRYGELVSYRRVLDMRAGTLTREIEWRSPVGQALRFRSVRLVSLVHRAVAGIAWEVEALDDSARLVVQSELVTNEQLPAPASRDPRAPQVLHAPFLAEDAEVRDNRVTLVHRTRQSALRVAAAMDHSIEAPDAYESVAEAEGDLGRVTITSELPAGGVLRIVKLVTYGWSSRRSVPAVRDQVHAALADVRRVGWNGLLGAQRDALDELWAHGDVELDGDPEMQQAVRFALFHTFQASARVEGRAIPAKGLTGRGYEGHAFWDTEVFVLPFVTYAWPAAAAAALRWRHSTLPNARTRAEVLGLGGAKFAWRTIAGDECAAYWPAGTAAFHVAAAVAAAVTRYVNATGDARFERETGLELLVETARLWRSLGHHHPADGFRIDGVTGPDEYSAIADNNVYTNLMAQRNLRAAADAAERHPDRAAELGVDDDECARWREAADAMVVLYDDALGVHPQAEGFTHHAEWDFEGTDARAYPLLLNYPYFDLYRRQVVKQPDLMLALHLCGDAFSDEQKARDFDYYERRTVRDSSLAAGTHAVVAAELGHLDLAYDYVRESALVDLHDLHGNTRSGLHLGSLAGSWLAVIAAFGGMRDYGGRLTFAPRLPPAVSRIAFRLGMRGSRLTVEIEREQVTYTVVSGPPLEIDHCGEPVVVERDRPVVRAVAPRGSRSSPAQPPGRGPLARTRQPSGGGEAPAAG